MFTFQPINFMKNVLIESDWNLKIGKDNITIEWQGKY